MMKRNFYELSSRMLAASVALFAAVLTGCDRREEVYPAEGNAYMHDPVFKAQLEAQVKKRDAVRKDFMRATRALNDFVKDESGGNFAAATNTPRGARLYAAMKESEKRFVANRIETAELTRERIERARADSQRIKNGEAKAVKIPPREVAKPVEPPRRTPAQSEALRAAARAKAAKAAAASKGAAASEGATAQDDFKK